MEEGCPPPLPGRAYRSDEAQGMPQRGRSEGFPVQLLPSMRRINMRVQPSQEAMGRWLGAPRL